MATILSECPYCHRKSSLHRKACKCGADLDPYSLDDARKAEAKLVVAKEEGKIKIFEKKRETHWTFQELTDWFLKKVYSGRVIRKGIKHPKDIESKLKAFNQVFGNVKVSDIKPLDLENYQTTLKQAGLALATINNRIGAAKDVINEGFKNDIVDAKPYKVFSRIKGLLRSGANARSETMSLEQYVSFIGVCRPWIRPLVEVAKNTGMRGGEIRGLIWPFIDKDFIRMPLELTKTNKPNTKEKGVKGIPINENVRKVLNQQVRNLHSDLVFQLRGREIPNKTLSREFGKDCEKAGIPAGRKTEGGITFHDIRSTVKTNMANAGVDPTFRDALLGHSRKGMDTYYNQIDPKDLISHMDKYTSWLNALLDKALDKGQKQHGE